MPFAATIVPVLLAGRHTIEGPTTRTYVLCDYLIIIPYIYRRACSSSYKPFFYSSSSRTLQFGDHRVCFSLLMLLGLKNRHRHWL